jgi:hypothetical protein
MRLLLCALLLTGCTSPVSYTTQYGIEVERPAPPPDASLVDAWTEDAAANWEASPCADLSSKDVLPDLQRALDNGLPVRLRWGWPPMSTGRHIRANAHDAYLHELSHALIDGYGLAPWGNDPHHRLMCQCGIPVGREVCARLGEVPLD